MKKIMILMLSLAVLFSFTACDNSSTTPDDTEMGETSSTVYDSTVSAAITEARDALSTRIAAMLPANDVIAVKGQTASFDDSMTLTVTKELTKAGEFIPATSVTLTVYGIDSSASTATGTASSAAKTVTLNSFTYVYSGYTTNAGTIVDYTATINGYFTDGPITATVYTDEKGQHYTPSAEISAENIVLPASSAGISLVIDEQKVEGKSLSYAWDMLVKGMDNTDTFVSYKGFVGGIEKNAVKDFGSYASRLIDMTTGDDSVVALITEALGADKLSDVDLSSFTHEYADGTATYTFSVLDNDTVIAKAASDAATEVRIRGLVNKPITVKFSASEAPADPTALLADSFTIEGTFVADTYVADSTNAYVNPVEFTATLAGNFGKTADKANTISIAINGTEANAVDLKSVTFALGNGSDISAEIPMGPEYVGGDNYAKDKTDVVLKDGSVALTYDADADTPVWKATATPAN